MSLIDLIYPPICPLCGKNIAKRYRAHPLCPECLDLQEKNIIKICEKPEFLPGCDILYCVYAYTDELREAIIKYKFLGEIWMAKPFAELMFVRIKEYRSLDKFDVVTNVPVSEKRFAERGYDQAYELAVIIAQKSNKEHIKYFKKNEKS